MEENFYLVVPFDNFYSVKKGTDEKSALKNTMSPNILISSVISRKMIVYGISFHQSILAPYGPNKSFSSN